MQTGGVVQGVNTIPHSRWLDALRTLAFVALVAGAMVLLVWIVPPATNGVGADDAPKAGVVSTVVHDDAGNMRSGAGSAAVANGGYPETYYPLPNGKLASLNAGAGSAIVHDDAGSVNR